MNKDFQTLRKGLVSGALLLSMMLTGCSGDKDDSKKVYVDRAFTYTEITYNEDGTIVGTLPSDKVDEFVKIITFKQGEVTFTRLVAIGDVYETMGLSSKKIVNYYDLDSGTTLISYNEESLEYNVGENLEIVEIKDFMPYMYQEGKIADKYDINDILNVYHEKVEPIVEETDEITLS